MLHKRAIHHSYHHLFQLPSTSNHYTFLEILYYVAHLLVLMLSLEWYMGRQLVWTRNDNVPSHEVEVTATSQLASYCFVRGNYFWCCSQNFHILSLQYTVQMIYDWCGGFVSIWGWAMLKYSSGWIHGGDYGLLSGCQRKLFLVLLPIFSHIIGPIRRLNDIW